LTLDIVLHQSCLFVQSSGIESRDSSIYFSIKDNLRARAADFIEQTYFGEVFPIDMFQNEPEDINGDRRHGICLLLCTRLLFAQRSVNETSVSAVLLLALARNWHSAVHLPYRIPPELPAELSDAIIYQSSQRQGQSCSLRLGAQTAAYRYFVELQAPKEWFKANVDAVLALMAPSIRFKRRIYILVSSISSFPLRAGIDLTFFRIVIGTLEFPDYALFISHQHPDG
jgi:hypothetical protein